MIKRDGKKTAASGAHSRKQKSGDTPMEEKGLQHRRRWGFGVEGKKKGGGECRAAAPSNMTNWGREPKVPRMSEVVCTKRGMQRGS